MAIALKAIAGTRNLSKFVRPCFKVVCDVVGMVEFDGLTNLDRFMLGAKFDYEESFLSAFRHHSVVFLRPYTEFLLTHLLYQALRHCFI